MLTCYLLIANSKSERKEGKGFQEDSKIKVKSISKYDVRK